MKWIIYPLVAVSYILAVLGIMFSGETLGFKFFISGFITLVYGALLGFFYSLFKSNERDEK